MDMALSAFALAMLLGSGAYALYTYLHLRKSWGFFPNKFLLPANCPPEECLDEDGYLEYISKRMLIFGCLCLGLGLLYLPVMLPNFAVLLGLSATAYNILYYAMPFLGVAVYVWFIICQFRASKKFWN